MSGLPFRLETATKKQSQAVAALANMEHELDSAESYAQIRKLADAAEALKILFRHVAEVKNKAELVVPGSFWIGSQLRLPLRPAGRRPSIRDSRPRADGRDSRARGAPQPLRTRGRNKDRGNRR